MPAVSLQNRGPMQIAIKESHEDTDDSLRVILCTIACLVLVCETQVSMTMFTLLDLVQSSTAQRYETQEVLLVRRSICKDVLPCVG